MVGSSARVAAARAATDLVVLEGFHPLKHALRFGATVDEVLVADPARLDELATRLAPDVRGLLEAVPVTRIAAADLATLAGGRSHGAPEAVAIARRPDVDVDRVLRAAGPAPIVLLERPTHLGNIGAVVRVAAAAGAAAVITTGELDPWHAAALRGSAGLHFALPVARSDDPMALLGGGRPLVAADPDGRASPADVPQRAIIALGSERRGLSTALLDRADVRIRIPMREGVSSLNLATAAAVLLYAGVRQTR